MNDPQANGCPNCNQNNYNCTCSKPASNEEIERRISEAVLKYRLSLDRYTIELKAPLHPDADPRSLIVYHFVSYERGIRLGLQLSSELKAQKPVDESLDDRAFKYIQEGNWKSSCQTHYKNGAKDQAPISEAIGEAKGWRDAIECVRGYSSIWTSLENEAKRRGIKL